MPSVLMSACRGNGLAPFFVREQEQEEQQMIHYSIGSWGLPRHVRPAPPLSEQRICAAAALCDHRQSPATQDDANCRELFTDLD